ncbi:hypothetical protein BU15DRAFT_84179 [Melanogaster broomeanus]|nr:hypothetical protein BU15DRAFT_84179 [Melanogaster broomeanus]
MKFVERKDIFDIFRDEIATVMDGVTAAGIKSYGRDPLTLYLQQRKRTLREIEIEIVKYATLSHRWDAAGELTYRDVTAGKHRNIAGFEKLTHFCKAAKSLGYNLPGLILAASTGGMAPSSTRLFRRCSSGTPTPTCASSTSQSPFPPWTLITSRGSREAGRSKNSWLLDVSSFTIKLGNRSPPDTTTNDKDDNILLRALSDATSIPEVVIAADNSKGINGRRVSEIMSWASKRETTRVEDIAYSLIGLFKVNLTTKYGEGERAFPRLVEAIMKRRPDWDVLAWVGKASQDYPAIPSSPACYPKFTEPMVSGDVGPWEFTTTNRGFLLSSLPLIAMKFESAAADEEGIFTVILKQQSNAAQRSVGTYNNVTVKCGMSQLGIIHTTEDLSLCILNYHFVYGGKWGKLRIGREYVCFLVHSEVQDGKESTWTKFTTYNSLRICCMDKPEMFTEGTGDIDRDQVGKIVGDVFSLPLKITYIRRVC